jgi:23S rRNA G2445 N2-methylase RlmL
MKFQLNSPLSLSVVAPRDMGPLVKEEIQELAALWKLPVEESSFKVFPGSVSFVGDWKSVIVLNYCLRIGTRVLLTIEEKKVQRLHDVYQNAYEVPWEEYFKAEQTLSIESSVRNPIHGSLDNSMMVSLKVKDAICDRMRKKFQIRPNIDKKNSDIKVYVKLHKDHMEIALDTTGDSLSHRGYREETLSAPIRENVAAGILRLMGFNAMIRKLIHNPHEALYLNREQQIVTNEKMSNETLSKKDQISAQEGTEGQEQEQEQAPEKKRIIPQLIELLPFFLDPMGGTGTASIEAALVMKNSFPSIYRKYFRYQLFTFSQEMGLMGLAQQVRFSILKHEISLSHFQKLMGDYLKTTGHHLNESAKELMTNLSRMKPVHFNDVDQSAMKAAQINAKNAGVEEFIQFQSQDFKFLLSPFQKYKGGFVFLNPPYGMRLDSQIETDRLKGLYKELGDWSKHHAKGHITWVLSANLMMLKHVGLRSTRKIKIDHGGTECGLWQFIIN